MKTLGYVVKTCNNKAVIKIKRSSACGDKCGACSGGCEIPPIKIKVQNDSLFSSGDLVEVKMKTKTILQSAFLVYIIPLIMMMIGVLAGMALFRNNNYVNLELVSIIMGMLFLGISHFIIKHIDKTIKDKGIIKYEVIRKLT